VHKALLFKERKAQSERRALVEHKDHLVLKVHKELLAHKAHKVHKVHKEHLVAKVLKVHKEHLVYRVQLVQELKERREYKVPRLQYLTVAGFQ
jgi:hypothetical protein